MQAMELTLYLHRQHIVTEEKEWKETLLMMLQNAMRIEKPSNLECHLYPVYNQIQGSATQVIKFRTAKNSRTCIMPSSQMEVGLRSRSLGKWC